MKGRNNYNMLLKMAESLAFLEHASQISRDQFRYLLQLVSLQLNSSLCAVEKIGKT